MLVPLSECEKLTGKSRGALMKQIQRGRLSASRDEVTGRWLVHVAELGRLYPIVSGAGQGETALTPDDPQIRQLGDRVSHLEDTIRRLEDERDFLRLELQAGRELLFRLGHQSERAGQVSPPAMVRWWIVAALVGLVLAGALVWAVLVGWGRVVTP